MSPCLNHGAWQNKQWQLWTSTFSKSVSFLGYRYLLVYPIAQTRQQAFNGRDYESALTGKNEGVGKKGDKVVNDNKNKEL